MPEYSMNLINLTFNSMYFKLNEQNTETEFISAFISCFFLFLDHSSTFVTEEINYGMKEKQEVSKHSFNRCAIFRLNSRLWSSHCPCLLMTTNRGFHQLFFVSL